MSWTDPTIIFWIIVIIVACAIVIALSAFVSFKAAVIFYLIYAAFWFVLHLWARTQV